MSSPFQFLEDYDIVVIEETKSMLVLDSKPTHLSGNYEKVSHELCAEKVCSLFLEPFRFPLFCLQQSFKISNFKIVDLNDF